MNEPQNQSERTKKWRGAEMLLFLAASAIGIYALGRGLAGVFEPGQGISLLWLAVTGVALFVLFAQMGRVHDTWPHRRKGETGQTTGEEVAQDPSVANGKEKENVPANPS